MKEIYNYLKTMQLPLLIGSFCVLSVSIVFNYILSILFGTRALWVEESTMVQYLWLLHKAFPYIICFAGLVFLLFATLKTYDVKTQRIALFFIGLTTIPAIWWPSSLYISIISCLFYIWHEKDTSQLKEIAIHVPIFYYWKFWKCFFILFTLTSLVSSLGEAFILIHPLKDKLFPAISFWQYTGGVLLISVMFGIIAATCFCLILQVWYTIIYYIQKRYRTVSLATVYFSFLLLHGFCACIVFESLTVGIFGDEINAFGLSAYIPLLIGIPMIMIITLTFISFKYFQDYIKDDYKSMGKIYFYTLIALGLSPIIPFIRGKGRKFYPYIVLMGYTIAAVILFSMNYPIISDYGAAISLVFTFLVLMNKSIFWFILSQITKLIPSKRQILAITIFLIVSIPFTTGFYNSHNTRMIMFEYSKITWAQYRMVNLSYLYHKKLGFGPTCRFNYYPPIYRKFTEKKLKFTTPPPVFIVLFDALRPDHTNLASYHRNITPNIQKIAEEGVFFPNAHSCASATSCSLKHLFSGHYSTRYMLEKKKVAPFFIQEMAQAGYKKFVINTFQSDYNGISLAAFKRNIPKSIIEKTEFTEVKTYDEFPKVQEALGYLKKISEEFKKPEKRSGVFCYLHFCRPHIPWHPTKAIFGHGEVDRYDAAIKEADQALGIFINGIKKLGFYKDAIIIILADHGTGLMEHGLWGGFLNYEEQIRIPIVIRVPGIQPKVSNFWATNIDIAPTLVNLISNQKKNRFHGISLVESLLGKRQRRKYIFTFSSFQDYISVIKDNRYKFHFHRSHDYFKLYDLVEDPGEKRNIVDQKPEMVKQFLKVCDRFLRAGNHSYNNPYHYSSWDCGHK